MAYATVIDMVQRFGQAEMIRASATGDTLPSSPNEARIQVALDDATGVIQSRLRVRYVLPLVTVPDEIVRACCSLARADLHTGDNKTPSDQMLEDRRRVLEWLEALATGKALIDAPAAGSSSGAMVQDRCREFSGRGLP